MKLQINNDLTNATFYNTDKYEIYKNQEILNINADLSDIITAISYIIKGIKDLNESETNILIGIYKEKAKNEKDNIEISGFIKKYSSIYTYSNITYYRCINNLINKKIIYSSLNGKYIDLCSNYKITDMCKKQIIVITNK